LCGFFVVAYFPQYLTIVFEGTHGVSSRFVLFHCLASTTTVALRLHQPIFFDPFACVEAGVYRTWKAYSALLGYIQSVVQWLCAVFLSVIPISLKTRHHLVFA
jgi:hypothetical protein